MATIDDGQIGARRATPPWPGGRLFFVSEFVSAIDPYRFEMGQSGTADEDPNFLFCLPEYSKAFGVVFADVLESLAKSKSPVLRELVTIARGQQVRTQRITTPSGDVIDVKPRQTAIPYRFTRHDVTRFDLRSFARACDEAADVFADEQLDHLLGVVGQIAEGLGQVGSAGGQPFGWPVLLLGLEQVEIAFSATGDPLLPKIVAENDKRHFVEYPPLTDADRPAFDDLIARKREHYARRGRR